MANCPTCKTGRGVPVTLLQTTTTEDEIYHCMVCGKDYDEKGNEVNRDG